MPEGASPGLLRGLADQTNNVQQGYQQVNSQIMAAQNLHDNNMLKVLEFAGNGDVDAATMFAKSKGIQVPQEVLDNADMAQGLHYAGSMYSSDPAAAQKFTTAWMQTHGMPLQQRVQAAIAQAGVPQNQFQEKFGAMGDMFAKKSTLPQPQHGKSAGQARYEAVQHGQDTASKALGATPASIAAAGQANGAEWDKNNPGAASNGQTFPDASPAAGASAGSPPPSTGDYEDDALSKQRDGQNGAGGAFALVPVTQPTPRSSSPPMAVPAPAMRNNMTQTTETIHSGGLPAGLPPGSIPSYTSGGQQMYQSPDGRTFGINGNPQ